MTQHPASEDPPLRPTSGCRSDGLQVEEDNFTPALPRQEQGPRRGARTTPSPRLQQGHVPRGRKCLLSGRNGLGKQKFGVRPL